MRSLIPPSQRRSDPVREGYWIYEWEEECSGFTPGAHWVAGSEYHSVTCRMWIPNSITGEDIEELEAYVEAHNDEWDAWVSDEGATGTEPSPIGEWGPTGPPEEK